MRISFKQSLFAQVFFPTVSPIKETQYITKEKIFKYVVWLKFENNILPMGISI